MQNVLEQVLSNQINSIYKARTDESKLNLGRFLPESLIDEYKKYASRTNKYDEVRKQNPNLSVDELISLTAKVILEDQVTRVNQFLNNNAVTTIVKEAYENCKFDMFDPANGDNNCQSRVFLLEILALKNTTAGVNYDNLPIDFKLVLTLCYVLREYKLEKSDIFGMPLGNEKANPSITFENGHNKLNLQSYSKLPTSGGGGKGKGSSNRMEQFSNAAELLSHAISEISCNYMSKLDELLTNGAYKDDLKPYQRSISNISPKNLPKQQYIAPAFAMTLRKISTIEGQVYAFKMTQMSCTSLAGSKSYKCEGSALLYRKVLNGKLVVVDANNVSSQEPIAIFEVYSIKGDTPFATYMDEPLVAPLAKTDNFKSYMQALSDNADLVDELIVKESIIIDQNASSKLKFANSELEANRSDAIRISNCIGKRYSKDGKFRETATSIISGCHFYISTKQIEESKITILPPSNITVGIMVNLKEEQKLVGGVNV